MKEDRLMRSLGQVAREREEISTPVDERLPALSGGELSEVEIAALREAADSSPEARRAYDAFRPLDQDARAGIVRRLQEELASSPAGGGEVVPLQPRIRRWRWAVAAAAALVAFALIWPSPSPSPLPDYELSLEGGMSETRASVSGEVPTFEPGAPFSLLLRPVTDASGKVAVRAWLDDGETLRVWQARPRISEGGSVLYAGTVGEDVPLPPGDWVLWLAIGRGDGLPDAAAIREGPATSPASRDWVLLKTPVRVIGER
ncbi:MAG: hypothetical protein GY719_38180 [bacterium]|nr:hypothetical protein [bacterium]